MEWKKKPTQYISTEENIQQQNSAVSMIKILKLGIEENLLNLMKSRMKTHS